jgi:hypothetical protein
MIALLDKIGATAAGTNAGNSVTSSSSTTNAALTYEDVELMWSALHGKAAALIQLAQYKEALVAAVASLDTAYSLEVPPLVAQSLAAVAKCKHVLAAGHKRELTAVLSLLKQQAAILQTILTAAATHAGSVCSTGSSSSSSKSRGNRAIASLKVCDHTNRSCLQQCDPITP